MLNFITMLHLLTYEQIVITGTVAVIWGIWAWRTENFSDGFRSILYVVAGTGVVQALLGGLLFLAGCRPENILHLVYGLIGFAAIPVAFTYTNETIAKRDLAVLAFAAFAIVAAAFRAYATGVGGYCPAQ